MANPMVVKSFKFEPRFGHSRRLQSRRDARNTAFFPQNQTFHHILHTIPFLDKSGLRIQSFGRLRNLFNLLSIDAQVVKSGADQKLGGQEHEGVGGGMVFATGRSSSFVPCSLPSLPDLQPARTTSKRYHHSTDR